MPWKSNFPNTDGKKYKTGTYNYFFHLICQVTGRCRPTATYQVNTHLTVPYSLTNSLHYLTFHEFVRTLPNQLPHWERALLTITNTSKGCPAVEYKLCFFYLVRYLCIFRNVCCSHQKLCEAGGRHREVDPCPEPEWGWPLPAPQPGYQKEEEAFLEEGQVCLNTFLTERHPGGRERDHSRYINVRKFISE